MSATPYDVVSYACHPLAQTHPARLGALGALLGISPPPVESCRVLELGCGDGSNLIPMASAYPHAAFIGLDLAESSVRRGNEMIGELGMGNITLRAADLLDFPASAGQFDFIIAHGVYSWVPAPVRDKIMSICRDHLSANGIAYISYNALPGCHIRRMLREMMRFHVRRIDSPIKKIEQALSLLNFLDSGSLKDNEAYAALLKKELKQATEKDKSVFYHDDLADLNEPYYFHEFIAHASAHGLQYLGEADVVEMSGALFPQAVRDAIAPNQDVVEREQYLDFLKCRRFRQTLLVRDTLGVARELMPDRLRGLSLSSRLKPDSSAPNLAPGAKESFRVPDRGMITIDLPLAKAVLAQLGEVYPARIRYSNLLTAARNRSGLLAGEENDAATLKILCDSFAVGLVEAYSGPPIFVRHASDKPMASPLARLQLQKGAEFVTSYTHSVIQVPAGISRALIMHLDGNRDRKALVDDLAAWAFANPAPGEPPKEGTEFREMLSQSLESGLEMAGAMGLLLR